MGTVEKKNINMVTWIVLINGSQKQKCGAASRRKRQTYNQIFCISSRSMEDYRHTSFYCV